MKKKDIFKLRCVYISYCGKKVIFFDALWDIVIKVILWREIVNNSYCKHYKTKKENFSYQKKSIVMSHWRNFEEKLIAGGKILCIAFEIILKIVIENKIIYILGLRTNRYDTSIRKIFSTKAITKWLFELKTNKNSRLGKSSAKNSKKDFT